jgi:hypothetical protein
MTATKSRNRIAAGGDGAEELSFNEKKMLFQFFANEMTTRADLLKRMTDPRRNIDAELGYPAFISSQDYYKMYHREGIATRICNLWPNEVFKVKPTIYEKEANAVTTAFEQDWEAFERRWHPWAVLKRADELSRVCGIGGVLFGFDDLGPNDTLEKPVSGISQHGERLPDARDNRLIYMRVFSERHIKVAAIETDQASPRLGEPTLYNIQFQDVSPSPTGAKTSAPAARTITRPVHWTRFLHLAPNRRESEVYGTPQMENSFNRLLDTVKTLGGSAEMFWRGAFAGLSIEAPAPTNGGPAPKLSEPERKKLRAEIEAYANGLQRYMALVGMTAKSLAPQVADPTAHVDAQLKMIAVAMNVPLRMLMGSEEGKQASTQDRKNWNDRVTGEANGYYAPYLAIPFVTRLILAGVLRAPAKDRFGFYDFKAVWPDLNAPTPEEIAAIWQRLCSGMKDYMLSGARQIIPPEEALIEFLRMHPKQAKAMVKAGEKYTKKHPEVKDQIAGKGTPPRTTGVNTRAGGGRNPGAPAEASAGAVA